jgi:hypothetical protein
MRLREPSDPAAGPSSGRAPLIGALLPTRRRPEPEASNDGQALGSGQAAASIHRIHHSNERPVGGAKAGHAEEPVPAAGTALSPYYLSPPHAC